MRPLDQNGPKATLSRRHVVNGMGTGALAAALLAATAGPAPAQQQGAATARPPGPFWTPLQATGGQPPEALETFGAMTPLKRPGQPAEIAPLYVMLALRESSHATGEVVGMTGGNARP